MASRPSRSTCPPTLFLFAVGLLALVGLPYLPAMAEWHRRLDATAMHVAEDYAETAAPHAVHSHDADWTADGTHGEPVHAVGDVRTAPGATLDAVRAGGSLSLAVGTTVGRHAHAAEHLRVGRDCTLHGSVSADGTATVGAGTRFERLSAPALFLGTAHQPRLRPAASVCFEPTPRRDVCGRYVVQGDLAIPAGALVGGTVIASGDVRLGAGARVDGDVRSGGDLVLAEGATVGGHAFADHAITLGPGAAVDGVAVARRRLALGADARVGVHDAPASATADMVHVEPGAIVYGTLWARIDGQIAALPAVPPPVALPDPLPIP